jgi:hypothetical protein
VVVVAGAAAAFLLVTLAVVLRVGPVIRFDAWVSAAAYGRRSSIPGGGR